MNSIKTFIIEEHHEAFIVWNYAIQQRLIPKKGNTLFHVDEHSDMSTPRFNKSINDLNGDMAKVIDFTYTDLDIANFIIPSAFIQLVDKIYWIKPTHRTKRRTSVNMYVRSFNKDGKRMMSGKVNDLVTSGDIETYNQDTDFTKFKYFLRTFDQVPANLTVILDIDLDYFSCAGNPTELEELYIEITKDEYDSFLNNRYHRINYMGLGKKIKVESYKDKFYYVINEYDEIYPNRLKVSKEQIKERIDNFNHILKTKNIAPSIINICRSRYSGYTPEDQWKYIEDTLLESLQEIYSLELTNLDQIIKNNTYA